MLWGTNFGHMAQKNNSGGSPARSSIFWPVNLFQCSLIQQTSSYSGKWKCIRMYITYVHISSLTRGNLMKAFLLQIGNKNKCSLSSVFEDKQQDFSSLPLSRHSGHFCSAAHSQRFENDPALCVSRLVLMHGNCPPPNSMCFHFFEVTGQQQRMELDLVPKAKHFAAASTGVDTSVGRGVTSHGVTSNGG